MRAEILELTVLGIIGGVLINTITWFAFTVEYPLIGWTRFGVNPEPFYQIGTSIIFAILLIGFGTVMLHPQGT